MLSYLYTLIPAEAQEGMMYLALLAGCSFLFGFFVSMGFKAHVALSHLRYHMMARIKHKIKEIYLNWKHR